MCVSLTNDPFSPLVILRSFFTVDPASCAHLSCLLRLTDATCFGGGGGVDGRGSVEKLGTDRIDGDGDGHGHGHGGDMRKMAATSATALGNGALVILEALTSQCTALARRLRGLLDREALALLLALALEDEI